MAPGSDAGKPETSPINCRSYDVNSLVMDTTINFRSVTDNRVLEERGKYLDGFKDDSDDKVFLGYFRVDSQEEERPTPAPRRLVRIPESSECRR